MALFWKIVEPLEDGALVEEVNHWRQASRFYTLTFFFCSLFPDCEGHVTSHLMFLLPYLPHHDGLSSAKLRARINCLLP